MCIFMKLQALSRKWDLRSGVSLSECSMCESLTQAARIFSQSLNPDAIGTEAASR